MPTSVGELTVNVTGSVSGLQAALKSAEDAINNFNSTVSRVAKLSELASAADTTVASLQAIEFAAAQTGISIDDLGKKAGEFNKNLEDETKNVKKGLKELKLTFEDMADLNFDDRLLKIAQRFKELGTEIGDQKDILEKFGLDSKEFLLLIQNGGEAIKQAKEDIERYGIALDSVDAAAAAQAHRELDAVMKRFTLTGAALWDQLSIVAVPVLDSLTKALLGLGGGTAITEGAVIQLARSFLGALDSMEVGFQHFLAETVRGSAILYSLFFALDSAMKIAQGRIDEISFKKFNQELDDAKQKIDQGVGFGDLGTNLKKFDEYLAELRKRGEKAAEERGNIDKLFIEGEKGLTDEQKKALEARYSAMLQATEREFSALNTAKERRLKLTEEENLADVKSREEINTLKMAIEDKFQRDLEKLRFQRFESYFATEAEKLEHQNAERLAALDDALKAGAVTEQKYADLRVKINQKAALDIMQANARMYTALANIVDTAMGHISALVDSEGKKQFTIFKAISVATALVKGYEAVVSAFAAGNKVGGPPVGFAFAAIAAAGVAAQIAKLVSTDVGSGSGTVAPVAAGDTGAAAAAAPLPNAGSTLTVQGISASSFFSGEQIRTIAEKLLQFQRDGGMVVLER